MGDMADMLLEEVITYETLRDDYANGRMDYEESYELGFVDSMGIEEEAMQTAWDRNPIRTYDDTKKDIELEPLRLDSY